MESNNDMLLSDFLFPWGGNSSNNSSNNIYDDPLSSSTIMANELTEDSSLLAMSSNVYCEILNQYQEPFNCNNDSSFYDLFPQEKLQFIIDDDTEPSSSQLMLHQTVYTNNSLTKELFTDNKPQAVVQKKNNSNKRKKTPTEQENKLQEKKKPKKKKKKKKEDVDPNAPPKPKRITGLNKPLLLSNSLQIIMEGATELSRPEIVKRLWNYIKSNQLQDPADRRFILCDEKLKCIFHKDRVNSFGMNRDLSAHLTKKDVLCTQDSDIFPSTISNTKHSQMSEGFSPVPTAETPDIMTPSDSEIFLQKWCSSL